MSDSSHTLTLPARCDISGVAALKEEIKKLLAAGQPVRVDAHAVERVDGACLQLLTACARDCEAKGTPFSVINPSDAFITTARLTGLAFLLGLMDRGEDMAA